MGTGSGQSPVRGSDSRSMLRDDACGWSLSDWEKHSEIPSYAQQNGWNQEDQSHQGKVDQNVIKQVGMKNE